MARFSAERSIANDLGNTFGPALSRECKDDATLAAAGYLGFDRVGDVLTFWFDADPTAPTLAALDAVLGAHTGGEVPMRDQPSHFVAADGKRYYIASVDAGVATFQEVQR